MHGKYSSIFSLLTGEKSTTFFDVRHADYRPKIVEREGEENLLFESELVLHPEGRHFTLGRIGFMELIAFIGGVYIIVKVFFKSLLIPLSQSGYYLYILPFII